MLLLFVLTFEPTNLLYFFEINAKNGREFLLSC